MTFRRLLWLTHGKECVLYGDDREMRCNTCMIDFKRMSVEEIDKRFYDLGMEKLKSYYEKEKELTNG